MAKKDVMDKVEDFIVELVQELADDSVEKSKEYQKEFKKISKDLYDKKYKKMASTIIIMEETPGKKKKFAGDYYVKDFNINFEEDYKFTIESETADETVKSMLEANKKGTRISREDFLIKAEIEYTKANRDKYFLEPNQWFIKFVHELQEELPIEIKNDIIWAD